MDFLSTMKILFKLIYFYLIVLSFNLFANNEYIIKRIGTNEGLSNNSVREIFQDTYGFLWFGTLNGLNRYDGKNFKYYYFIPEQKNSLSSNRIIKLYQDKNKFLWIITYDKKLHRLDLLNDNIINFNFSIQEYNVNGHNNYLIELLDGEICVISDNNLIIKICNKNNGIKLDTFKIKGISKITFLFYDNNSGIWVGTNNGLYFYKNKMTKNEKVNEFYKNQYFTTFHKCKSSLIFATDKGILYKYNYETKSFYTFFEKIYDYVTCINSYKDSILLVGTRRKGIFHIVPNKNIYEHYINGKNGIRSNYIYSIYADKYGLFWLITDLKGILCYYPQNKIFKYHSLLSELRENIMEGEKYNIIEDKNNNLWITTYGSGLFKFNRKKNDFIPFTYNKLNSNTISSNFILSIYEDNSGNLWIGTRNGGVNKFRTNDTIFINISPENLSKNSHENEVRALTKDNKNRIWAGTKGGQLFYFDSLSKSPIYIYSKGEKRFLNSGIYSLLVDSKNNLWIGTKGEGIIVLKNIYDKVNQSIDSTKVIRYNYPLLSGNFIYSIVEDFNGNIWIGTYLNGINVIKNPLTKNELIEKYLSSNDDSNSLSDNRVRCLYFDCFKNLWIGTVNGLNLLKYDKLKNNKIEFIRFFPSNKPNTINYNDILSIYQDIYQNIWIGTFGGGLNMLKKENLLKNDFQWNSFFDYKNPSTNVIYNIVHDKLNNLWCATDYGLKKISLSDYNIENYSNSAIINDNSFSEANAVILNNIILMGHTNGFLLFDPSKLNINLHKYPLYITKIKILGEDLKFGVDFLKHIKLKYNQNYIEFSFSLLDYYAPENIQYAYILENYDKTWNFVGTNENVIYKQLKPGKYVFKVKATNRYGVWNNNYKSIQIIVSRPPWLSCFAISFYAILLIFCIYFVYSYIHLKNKIIIDRKVYESKLKFFTNLSHELKTPLTLILAPVKNILSCHPIDENVKKELIVIKKNVLKLSEIIEQMLDLRKVQEGKFIVSYEEVDVINFLKEVYNLFLPLANQKSINFKFYSNYHSYYCCTDKNILEKIMYNLLSNAFKNTPLNKSISVIVNIDDKNNLWYLNVNDEGKGIAKNILPKIFERFNFSKDYYGNEISGSGIGLSLTNELVKLLNGKITIESQIDKGTNVIIEFPIVYDRKNDKLNKYFSINTIEKEKHLAICCDKLNEILKDDYIENNKTNENKTDTILIIEDDDDLRKYLFDFLINYYNVLEANNGIQGMEIAKNLIPDLILCDLVLPGKDGYEICISLKNDFNTCHIPIIVVTSLSKNDSRMLCYEIGADDYIIKPFEINVLLKRIENIIKLRKLLKNKFSNDILCITNTFNYSQKDKNFLESLTSYIYLNVENNDLLTIDKILENFKIGRTLFYKKIKTLTGLTPHDLILNIKMKKALELLKNSDLSIYEISFKLGFNDPDYFTKCFKNFYGITPSEVLKNKKGNQL